MRLHIPKRRRRECKTDYKFRKEILKSPLPRIVIRKTNKYLILQMIESKESQDKVIVSTTSKELLKQGWDKKFEGSLKSVPASYLTGLLMAKKLKKGEFVIDTGIQRSSYCGRIYSSVKGLLDGKLKINVNEKVFPDEERINGMHMSEEVRKIITKVKEKIKNVK
jgi:large subunit ribosomal protein L18